MPGVDRLTTSDFNALCGFRFCISIVPTDTRSGTLFERNTERTDAGKGARDTWALAQPDKTRPLIERGRLWSIAHCGKPPYPGTNGYYVSFNETVRRMSERINLLQFEGSHVIIEQWPKHERSLRTMAN